MVPDIEVEEATCTRCGLTKLATDFYPEKRKRNGLNSWCKTCMKARITERRKERYQTDPVYRARERRRSDAWNYAARKLAALHHDEHRKLFEVEYARLQAQAAQ